MKNHLDQCKAGAENKKEFFTQVATDSGLAPNAVIPPLLPLSEFDRNRALAVRDPTAAAPTAPPPRRGADAVIGR